MKPKPQHEPITSYSGARVLDFCSAALEGQADIFPEDLLDLDTDMVRQILRGRIHLVLETIEEALRQAGSL